MTTLALVGAGHWGKNYVKTIGNLSSCELPDKFIKTTDYKDLFSSKIIDGVIIATPASTHCQIAKEFLERGFNILIEKPMTTSYNDALKLYKIAEKFKNVVMVGHIFLYNPAFLEVKKLLKKVGKIKYMSLEGMDYGPIRSDISSLWDWAPHDVSMSIDLLESMPTEVCGYGLSSLRPKTNFYDMCYLKLTFPNDIFVFINVGWLSPIKKRNMIIVGEENAVIFDDTIEKKISFIKNLNSDKEINHPSFPKESPLSEEISAFVNLINSKEGRNTSGLKMGLDVIKIIEACEKSIQLGGKVIRIN